MEIEGVIINCKVHYESPGFMLVSDQLDDGYKWLSDHIEVDRDHIWIPEARLIGNIHDNPELLTEGK